ncbi:hypothetical protein [Micromonospora sp. NPDC126480]|uniref:hypothetical protein n=1 Tax=Micromonospora sp. NPDC126480 TaxID=3155312 RepID=UPI0033196E89
MNRTLRMAFAVAMAAILGLVVQAPAHAALGTGYWVRTSTFLRGADKSESYDRGFDVFNKNDKLIGIVWFNSDPVGDDPGDALQACDYEADGVGIEIQMDINPGSTWQTDRIATTRGHNSPYCSPWATGNIGENTLVKVRACVVQGTESWCSAPQYGRA